MDLVFVCWCFITEMALIVKDSESSTCNRMHKDPCRSVYMYFHALSLASEVMVTQVSVFRLAVFELLVIVMVFHVDDPSLSCTIRIPRNVIAISLIKHHCDIMFE